MPAWKPFKVVTRGFITLPMHQDFLYIDTILTLIIAGEYNEHTN